MFIPDSYTAFQWHSHRSIWEASVF